MKVNLIAVTQSMIENKVLTAEELLVYIARVSNPENQLNTATADKLLRYLIRNKHWSPFDMVNLVIEVKTSRAIGQQILRHWSIKPQEFSQRYSEAVEVEPIELRRAASKNRQSSEEVFDPKISWFEFKDVSASLIVQTHVDNSKILYRKLIDAGIAKECARMVLPLATSTTIYLNGSCRSWIHYLEQRTSEHAQKEHRVVAKEIERIFQLIFPNLYKAIVEKDGL